MQARQGWREIGGTCGRRVVCMRMEVLCCIPYLPLTGVAFELWAPDFFKYLKLSRYWGKVTLPGLASPGTCPPSPVQTLTRKTCQFPRLSVRAFWTRTMVGTSSVWLYRDTSFFHGCTTSLVIDLRVGTSSDPCDLPHAKVPVP